MSVHESYNTVEKAAQLRADVVGFREAGKAAGLDWPESQAARFDWLVAIPSNADVVASAILGLRPRRVLLLATTKQNAPFGAAATDEIVSRIQELREWLTASGNGLVGHEVELVIRGDGPQGMMESQILPTIEREIPAPKFKHTAIAMTGGQTSHKIAFGRYAEVHRMWQVLSNAERVGQDFVPGSISLKLDLPPFNVTDRLAEARARLAVRSRAYGEARDALGLVAPSRGGLYREALLHWVESCSARDAMRFNAAAKSAAQALETLASTDSQSAEQPRVKALCEVARRQQERCLALSKETEPEPESPRLHLIVEVIRRGLDEEAAGRLNHAALMYYRAIEAILSERLRVAWGVRDSDPAANGRLPTKAPHGRVLATDASALEARYLEIARSRHQDRADLRRPLGLVDKLVLLVALDDPNLPESAELNGVFKALTDSARARNSSIFAHGFREMHDHEVARLRSLLVAARGGGNASVANGLIRLLVEGPGLRGVISIWNDCFGHLSSDGLAFELPPAPHLLPPP